MLGDVHVYVWDLIPGPAFCQVRRQFLALDVKMEQRLYQTVEDFARSVGTCSTDVHINWKNLDSLLRRGTIGRPLSSLFAYLTSITRSSTKSPRTCLNS